MIFRDRGEWDVAFQTGNLYLGSFDNKFILLEWNGAWRIDRMRLNPRLQGWEQQNEKKFPIIRYEDREQKGFIVISI